ncbi:hypothetical protein BC831DRAFT_461703 [Entophlyctis helioformis]|nr:hypothetical protein BC831DRAFT_461703 [Entophlyctis helioformis]
MSCVLVGLTAVKVTVTSFSRADLAWCTLRDSALAAAHIFLLVSFGADPCLHSSDEGRGVYSWFVIDIILSCLRLVKNPLHYYANKRLEATGSNWENPAALTSSTFGSLLYGRVCGLSLYTSVDWLTYIFWIYGTWTIRTDIACRPQSPLAITAYWELNAASVVYFLFMITYAGVFVLNRASKGVCCPGFALDNSRWPDSCPTIRVDRTAWRRSGESLDAYRERRRAEFEALGVVSSQPAATAPMQTPQRGGLSEQELGQLRTFVFSDEVGVEQRDAERQNGSPLYPPPPPPQVQSGDPKTGQAMDLQEQQQSSDADNTRTIIVVSSGLNTPVSADDTGAPSLAILPGTGTASSSMMSLSAHMAAHPASSSSSSLAWSAPSPSRDIALVDLEQASAHMDAPAQGRDRDLVSTVSTVLSGNDSDDAAIGRHVLVPEPESATMGSTSTTMPVPVVSAAPDTVTESDAVSLHERTTDHTCALCLCDYENGDRLRELFCRHRFHAECVDEWLVQGKRKCPVCNCDALGVVGGGARSGRGVLSPHDGTIVPPWLEDRTGGSGSRPVSSPATGAAPSSTASLEAAEAGASQQAQQPLLDVPSPESRRRRAPRLNLRPAANGRVLRWFRSASFVNLQARTQQPQQRREEEQQFQSPVQTSSPQQQQQQQQPYPSGSGSGSGTPPSASISRQPM